MSFRLNHRVFYEETDLLLRYGRCPSSSYTVTDAEGEMYLCNSRCLCIWAVMLVTKHNLPESERGRSFVVTSPVGKKRSFDKLMDLAQWAAANALANLKANG
jgi:hypothetical protein